MATQSQLEILLDKSMNPSTPLGQKVFKRSMIEILGDDYDFDNTPIRQIELDLFNMAALSREDMEEAIRTIELQFGQDPSDLEELDLIDIKEIYNEYMDKYAQSSRPPTISMAKSGGEVLSRPMFRPQIVRRQTGTPKTGETSIPPFLQFNILDKLGVIDNSSLNREVPDKSYKINLDDAMTNPQLLNTVFEMITGSTDFDLDAFMNMGSDQQDDYLKTIKGRIIFGKAEGGEMKSDAVGIADGLDQETMQADPNTEGVAKVSPEQYVELMNQVRGDEVPMEGRVQELAMTVGEKDAQDTPLSVLALVQPVFELQEQQGGLAAAPGAQQMMQQQNPMMMKEGGIVYRENGTDQEGENAFSSLAAAGFDQNMLDAVQSLGKEYFGVGSEFDTQAARQQYEQMLINKSQMRDQAYLDAAPLLLQLGATALNPEASISDVFTVGASNLAKFGTNVGKQTKALQDQALKLALADKQKEENKESAFMSAIAPKLLDTAFKDPQQIALTALDITSKTLDNLEKETKLGVLDKKLQTELATSIASLEKMKTENKYLGTTLQLDIETKLEQLYGIQYDNNKKQLDNEYQTIMNNFAEDKENAELQGQLLGNINQQLINAQQTITNEYLPLEKDLGLEELNANINNVIENTIGQAITNEKGQIELESYNEKLFLDLVKTQSEIDKLEAERKAKEIEANKIDYEAVGKEQQFRKEFDDLKIVEDTTARYTAYGNLLASAKADSASGDVAFIFEFMRMVDPKSVVKEAEFELAENASPYLQRIFKLLKKAETGERLSSDQREEFLLTAGGILQSQLSLYDDTYDVYSGIAGKTFGADKLDVVMPRIAFDEGLLNSVKNQETLNTYLKSIGISD